MRGPSKGSPVRAVRAAVLMSLLGCGAKTGLPVPEVDAAVDAPPDAPADAPPDVVVPPPTTDRCIEVPYMEPPSFLDVRFQVRIETADVVFLVDVTGSMSDEIDVVRRRLRDVIAPGLAEAVPDVRIGVATFADFPVPPYGDAIDRPFRLLLPVVDDLDAVQAVVDRIETTSGGDGPESQVEALYQVATGRGRGRFVPPARCPSGTLGAPCFRPVGARIVLLFTDAPFHNGPGGDNPYGRERALRPYPATYDEALEVLRSTGIKVLGLYSGGGVPDGDLRQVVRDTGAVTEDGRPLVFDIGTGGERLDRGVVDVVTRLVEEVPIDIDVLLEDWPGDDVDATRFVERVEAVDAMPPSGARRLADRFEDVRPGTTVRFRLVLRNELLMPGPEPLHYPLRVVVRGDGVNRLREEWVDIVVPEEPGTVCPTPVPASTI